MHRDSAIDGVATVRARRGVELRGGVGGGKPGGCQWVQVADSDVAAERALSASACSRAALAAVSGEAEFLGLPRRALLELVQSEELAAGAAERAGGVRGCYGAGVTRCTKVMSTKGQPG